MRSTTASPVAAYPADSNANPSPSPDGAPKANTYSFANRGSRADHVCCSSAPHNPANSRQQPRATRFIKQKSRPPIENETHPP